ncbi:TPA: phage tail tape measure protein [Klebsiella pneumoniae]|uniref:phage tail tape measure protein n=1 Tax=Enterobacteriaceae TaxID=543 RepID=UPI0007CBDFD8|nr:MULTISPECIES: phage tail tape measure protein [Enterobacteriaceae]HBR7215467.1 phage tail tape measure protein [Klebsiella aerogenes]HCA9845695.1 phage tail tape measure protein [Klebsiella variicola subsp. variicola]EFA4635749.1 phage tail tape measure protein [Escherichia coli]MDA5092174.1 phage tail tape measure protein [Klebsiella quasipneumoniae subsp. quasipneumoniae]MDO2837134.1 phage tail tape measure protein [Escherichia coli]
MRSLQLAMTLLAKDQGSKVLRQTLADVLKQTNANKKAEEEAARVREQSAQSGIRASRTLQQEYQRAANARSVLGIRSERDIQREIAQTQAAYNRLLRTGTLTANEQTRAFRAMTNQVAQLRTELNGAGQSMSRMERARMWGGNVTAFAGGIAAAGAIVAPSVRNQMTYEQRLASMANTAFAEQNTAGRRAGMRSMDQLIRRSVAVGGGNKETAANTLDTLLASGAVEYNSAERLLPMLQKYSTATGADSKDLAMIAIRLKQTFGLKDSDIPKALNMAISAGQAGSFELADMAKYLPEQLANASSIGMKGLDDFATLLGLNQASAITAGTSDKAGNNVINLLGKISSQDASNAAARIKINGKGIDLPGSLAAAQGKGMNALDAFSAIVDKIVAQNPGYQKLEKQLKNTPDDPSRLRIMDSQLQILQGSAVGQIIADREALMALIAYRGNRKYAYGVRDDANAQRTLPELQTAGERNFDLIQGTNLYKVNQLNNTRDFAQMDSIQPLSDVLGKLSGELNDYAGAYPGLTKALAGAETAIKAMTAAAWAFAGIKFLSSAGAAATAAGTTAAGAGTAAATATRIPGWAGRLGLGRVLAPFAVWQGAEAVPLMQVSRGDAEARGRLEKGNYPNEQARMLDALKSRPGLMDAWDEVKSWWASPSNIRVPESANGYPVPPFARTPSQQPPINITTKLELDGRVIAEAVNEVNGQSAARGPQGGPH